MRGTFAALALAGVLAPMTAAGGPVFQQLDGPRHCPRDRPPGAGAIDATQAVPRARPMLPDGFCGPSAAIDGCDADVEVVSDTFRVFFHQYKQRGGRRDWTLLDHAYVILDRVGNCIAHIPGTGTFERAS